MLVKRISTGEAKMLTDFVVSGKFPQWWRNLSVTFQLATAYREWLSVTNLSSENNLPTFQLNAPDETSASYFPSSSW